MNSLYKNPLALLLIVITILAFIFLKDQLPTIDFSDLTPENVIAALGYLSILILIVEQFIEIFVFDPKEKIKQRYKNRIARINKFLERFDNPMDNTPIAIIEPPVSESESLVDQDNDTEVVKVIKEKRRLEAWLNEQALKRQRLTLLIGLIIGLILALAGFRILSGILEVEFEDFNQEYALQKTFITVIDIILTAGIIAGGSDRIHNLIKRIKKTIGPAE